MKARLTMTVLVTAAVAIIGCGDLRTRAHFSVDSVAYAPDGTLVVLTNGGIFLYDDPRLETRNGQIPLIGLPAFEDPARYRYSLSRDGTTAAVSYSPPSSTHSQVALYRVPTGERSSFFEVEHHPPAGPESELLGWMALSPNADLVAMLTWIGDQPKTGVYDATGQGLWAAMVGDFFPLWSPDSSALYGYDYTYVPDPASGGQQLVWILNAYDALAGLRWTQHLELQISALGMLGDGRLSGLASRYNCPTGSCPTSYVVWAADGSIVSQVPTPGTRPEGSMASFTCSSTDDVCAALLGTGGASDQGRSVRVYRTDGTVLVEFPVSLSTIGLALSPDGQYIAVSDQGGDEVVSVHRITDGTVVGSHGFTAELF